jgi:hypothetical protein
MSGYTLYFRAVCARSCAIFRCWPQKPGRICLLLPGLIALPAGPALASPDVKIVMTAQVISDPVSNSNPKAIPGSILEFQARVIYSGPEALGSDSLTIVNAVPSALSLVVAEAGPSDSSPFLFVDGDRPSDLICNFQSLDDSSDCIEFSSDGGASFDYRPTPDLAGTDPSITHLRFRLRGAMPAALPEPSFFTIKYRMRID